MKKLKFYMIGLIPGLIIVFFILNKKGASCSGYLPNSRVIAETLSKDFTYSDQFKAEMAALNVNEKFLKDSIITKGKIDFDNVSFVYPDTGIRALKNISFQNCLPGRTLCQPTKPTKTNKAR